MSSPTPALWPTPRALQSETQEPGSTNQWPSTRPGTPWGPAPPTSRLTLDPGPAPSPATTHSRNWPHPPVASSLCTMQAWQPTRVGASHTYQNAHSSLPNRRTHAAQIGGTPQHNSGDQRAVAAGMHRMSLQKVTSPRLGNITNLPHTQK